MLFINATLSKNQLYKLKNQINKVHTFIKQDDIELFSKYFCARHFTNVSNLLSCYHNGEGVHLTLPPRIIFVQVKSRNILHHGSVGASLKQNKRNLKKPNSNLNPNS